MTAQTTDMRTWAMGRELIDLPKSWNYSTGSDVTFYYGLGADHKAVSVRILAERITPQLFASEVARRANLIRAVGNTRTGGSMLLESTTLDPQQILLRYQRRTDGNSAEIQELHRWVEGVYVMIKAEAYDGVIAPVTERIKTLASSIEKIADPERAGPGFALGPIIIRGNHDHESASITYYLPASNVSLKIYLSAITPNTKQRLIPRFKQDADDIGYPYKLLKQGPLTIATMASEQVLVAFRGEDHRLFKFMAETYRATPSLAQQTLSVTMSGGGPKRRTLDPDAPVDLVRWSLPSFVPRYWERPLWQRPPPPPAVDAEYTDHEAIGVWDAIIGSIRPRGGAVAPPVPPAPPKPTAYRSPTREQAEAERRGLDAFLASPPRSKPKT
ncbi:T6SS immunity protein Tli4 family protein [Cupriavidus basilensis]|uniref:T6SS immunity protein Tli4 family protein n=1 Tax=Cupriavidus basilensis TaxID=68895 RepID=A0ABT6ATW0_9BURK|nr:T6SS immunity protein Tli4 family protein [Cupriavidus basilensis]MDF3836062.1 T6SS immunity protein Tli4 family protein [Cupriavidus basilensis]